MNKFRKLIITLFVFAMPVAFYAQVTIGSNSIPNADAVLDLISSNTKGLLLPRLALSSTSQATPLASHVAGMTVYNTATSGDVTPGIYFNNGTKWICVADLAKVDQSKDAFVNDEVNSLVKLGTLSNGITARSDNSEFVIRDNGNVGIGTLAPTTSLSIAERILFRSNLGGDPIFEMRGSGWNRIGGGTSGSSLAFWGNGNASVDNLPQLFLSGTSGYVGIGNTIPSQKLDVSGAVKFSGALMPANIAGTNGQVLMSSGAASAPVWTSLSATNTPNIYTADGILSSNRVVGQANYTLAFTSTATSGTSHFTIDGSTLNVDAVNNRIGLGALTPLSRLHLGGENTPTITIRGAGTTNTASYPQGRITFLESGSTNYGFNLNMESPAGGYNSLRIQANEGGALSDILTVEATGNVGIGVSSPTATIDVNGGARVRVLENANAEQPNCSNFTRNVVADVNGKLGYVNKPTVNPISYTSKISDLPFETTYTVAGYYPVLLGFSFANYSYSGGFNITWDNSGTYWKYDFLAATNSSQSCSIQVLWIPR